MRIAIVDTGVLYAICDAADPRHRESLELFRRPDFQPVVPALILAETGYLVGSRLGPAAEATLMRSLAGVEVEPPAPADYDRIGALVEQYADFPLGTADASVIALAERLDTDLVLTLDRRHFGAVRPAHCDGFDRRPR